MKINSIKKLTLYSVVFVSLVLFVSHAPLFAQTEYKLLQPLPTYVQTTAEGRTTAGLYIEGIFTLLIGLAGVLAVVMIIVGGIKYMSTDAFSGKSEAKNTIQNAIGGLLLALGAWVILNTISPNLVNFSFEGVRPTAPPPVVGEGAERVPWPDDSALRQSLLQNGITVQRASSCLWVGQTACTSLAGLGGTVISGLGALRANCLTCMLVINGGTEYWLHGNRSLILADAGTDHVPGGNAVDLDNTTTLNRFILDNGQSTSGSGCSTLGPAYRLNRATYVNEGNHWHVCY